MKRIVFIFSLLFLLSSIFPNAKTSKEKIIKNISNLKELHIYHWNKGLTKFTVKSNIDIPIKVKSKIIEHLKTHNWLKTSEQEVQISDEPSFAIKSDNKITIYVYTGIKRFIIDDYTIYYSNNDELKSFIKRVKSGKD